MTPTPTTIATATMTPTILFTSTPTPADLLIGVNMASWWAGQWQSTEGAQSFQQLATCKKVKAVEIVYTKYVDNVTSSNFVDPDDPNKNVSINDIRAAIDKAKSYNYKVWVKIHIDLKTGEPRTNLKPDNIQLFFENLTKVGEEVANLSQEKNCDGMVIATELKQITGAEYKSYWVNYINNIRSKFSGKLCYAANWDEYQNVSFWSNLDNIGIDMYTTISAEPDPSYETLLTGWRNELTKIETWYSSYGNGKEFFLTEVGCKPCDSGALTPYDPPCGCCFNGDLQKRFYEAVIAAAKEKPFIKAIFFWYWKGRAEYNSTEIDFPPQGKPAEQVLK
jgi:hypothetical protein